MIRMSETSHRILLADVAALVRALWVLVSNDILRLNGASYKTDFYL